MMTSWRGDGLAGIMGMLVRHIGVVAVVLVCAGASVAPARAQDAEEMPIPACALTGARSDGEPLLATDTESALAASVPTGLVLGVLADEATEEWPAFARGLVLTVRHLTLDPGVASATRQSQGPLLFFVESGTVGVSINGQPQVLGEGDALLIEQSKNYQLRNDDPANLATLLRVQVVPPGSETKVARGDIAIAVDDEQALAPGPPYIQSRLLLTTDVPAVEGLTHLVLGCLSWMDAAADPGEAAHAGPVALLVLRGELLVGDSGSVVAGQCMVFQRHVPHRLRAGATPPLVLLIGVLPDGAPFWAEPVESVEPTGRFAFSCEPGVQPDAIPDAARIVPLGSAMRARV